MTLDTQHASPMCRAPFAAGRRGALRGVLRLAWLVGLLAWNGWSAAGADIHACPEAERVMLVQPGTAQQRELLAAAGPGVALIAAGPDQGLEALVAEYRRALQQAGPQVGLANQPLTLLSVGPLLDSPDRMEARRVRCTPGLLEVDIDVSASRQQGVQLRRNVGWHPLAMLALGLPAGDYLVRVNWHAATPAREGRPPMLLQGRFVIR